MIWYNWTQYINTTGNQTNKSTLICACANERFNSAICWFKYYLTTIIASIIIIYTKGFTNILFRLNKTKENDTFIWIKKQTNFGLSSCEYRSKTIYRDTLSGIKSSAVISKPIICGKLLMNNVCFVLFIQ